MGKKKDNLPPKVRKRKNGYTYRYDIKSVDENGNSVRKQKETPQYATAQEAYEAGVLIEAEMIKGVYVDEDNILFSDWAATGLMLHANMKNNKDRGTRTHLSRLNRAKRYFAGKKLKDITQSVYEGYLLHIRDDADLSESMVKNTHSTMRIVFKQAKRRGIIAIDPTDGAELPVYRDTIDTIEDEPLAKYLEREQLLHVLRTARVYSSDPDISEDEAFKRRQMYRAVFILAYTGLRIGELLSLERRKWNRKEATLTITASIDAYGGPEKTKLTPPKNKSSRRIVDVSESVEVLIDEQIKDVTAFRLRKGDAFYQESTFIFVRHQNSTKNKNSIGRPMSPRVFEIGFSELMEHCNLPQVTPHWLRHTFTSLSAEAGVPLEDVQKQLGHANDSMTKRVYLHITKPRRKANVAKLDALLRDNHG